MVSLIFVLCNLWRQGLARAVPQVKVLFVFRSIEAATGQKLTGDQKGTHVMHKEDHQWRIRTEIRIGWRFIEKPFWSQTARKSRHASPKLKLQSASAPANCGTGERQKRLNAARWTQPLIFLGILRLIGEEKW